jgi:hypothetical protein
MKYAILPVLVTLSACGALDPDAKFTNANCRAAIYQDPTVRARLANTTGPQANSADFQAAEQAKQSFYDACAGATEKRRGGVQKVL